MPERHQPDDSSYILDVKSGAEMARLMKQDHLLTKGMGGLFSERDDISTMHKILDIACGPGGWALEVAFAYPSTHVVGVDISPTMIKYAQAQAWSQGLENTNFREMNILSGLDFPDSTFDLVNARFLVGFMPQTTWPKLLQECIRITRPGGIIRLTEFDEPGTTNSLAFARWEALAFRAIQLAGLTSSPDGRNFGITPLLNHLLQEAGCTNIEQKAHVIDFSSGSEAFESMYENCVVAFNLVQPFLVKMGVTTPEEAEQSYQQMLYEMMQEEFCGLWYYLTTWGQKPH